MSLEAILIDWRPRYLEGAEAPASLLLSPLGRQTVLTALYAQVQQAQIASTLIVANFPVDDAYRSAVQAILPDAKVASATDFDQILAPREHADQLVIIDPRYYPVEGLALPTLLRGAATCRLARYQTLLRTSTRGTRERVVYDADRRVRAIERLYDGVTQVESAGVPAALLSVAALRRIEHPEPLSPTRLRALLAAAQVPGQDLPLSSPAFDLSEPHGYLTLNERLAVQAAGRPATNGDRALPPTIRAGHNCTLDPEARLYGPVLLHDSVRIDAGAVIIGPTVLGRGVQVDAGAIVSQSVVLAGSHLAAGACATHRVVAPGTVDRVGVDAGGAHCTLRPEVLAALQEWRGNGSHGPPRWRQRVFWYDAAKRLFDTTAALCGLLVLSPLLAVVALLVKLTSRGPIFFAHEREGRGGRVFRCWKFRTMVDRAHMLQRQLYQQSQVDGPQFKIDRDPRVTPLGAFLRSSNIDELPQLFNVIRGHMSLIGPRPSPFRENQICVPWRKARLSVRPGITGLWQVCRHDRSTGDFHQWIYFDLLYVRHRSLMLDVRIMLATFLTLGGRWNVPLSWMIPQAALDRVDQYGLSLPLANPRATADNDRDDDPTGPRPADLPVSTGA
jgi:YD repeat-containing protein